MKRSLPAIAGSVALLAAMPAVASASIIELGETTTPIAAPTCPTGVSKAQCTIILTETTALTTASDGANYPTTVRTPGKIVAYTLGMAKLTKADITTLDATYGGAPQVQISVLRPGKNRLFTLEAQSKPNPIQPWFGHVVQWPLHQSLDVNKGDVIGLTVLTWAPVLTINLAAKPFQYRASRTTGCALQSTFSTQSAQLTIGAGTQYLCRYTATRVQYTATEITTPPVPKDAVK